MIGPQLSLSLYEEWLGLSKSAVVYLLKRLSEYINVAISMHFPCLNVYFQLGKYKVAFWHFA